ncbi:unnamed protein product [Closterium sp. NIES-53]
MGSSGAAAELLELENDGFTAQQIFNQGVAYTYDDCIFHPRHISFAASDVDLTGRVTRGISLRMPLVSSPMDTVTEAEMAAAMAAVGGMGFIHYNNSVQEQADMIRQAKQWRVGVVNAPPTLPPTSTVQAWEELVEASGQGAVCVTDDGSAGGRLVGVVTRNDVDFVDSSAALLSDVMTPLKDLVTAAPSCSHEDAKKLLQESKRSSIPLVAEDGALKGLLTRALLKQHFALPPRGPPSLAADGRALVGAAVGTRDSDRERVAALVEAGVDAVVLDSSQGDSSYQLAMLAHCKRQFPDLQIIAGNVVTARQARRLIEGGADGIRVGMGSGSICTTQEVCAVGRGQCIAPCCSVSLNASLCISLHLSASLAPLCPLLLTRVFPTHCPLHVQAAAVFKVASLAHAMGEIPVIADGGVSNTPHAPLPCSRSLPSPHPPSHHNRQQRCSR